MLRNHFNPRALMLLGLGLSLVGAAQADDTTKARVPLPPKYQQECSACHLAFPPGMLPTRSWTNMMGTLDKHYGTDASLDEASVREISGWLKTNAGTYKRVAQTPPEDRITRTAWFEREHRRIDPKVWTHASVKSAANCAACHTAADKGNFDDNSLRFPAGLDARYRRGWKD